ncbi:hypothetical protein [Nocardia amamiensis]|uniref:hypothetical protein n=1 Tax=Nocardia amamiensis TaxID=404578 RepID=UPI0033E6EB75
MSIEGDRGDITRSTKATDTLLKPILARVGICMIPAIPVGLLADWGSAAQVFVAAAGIAAITKISGQMRNG